MHAFMYDVGMFACNGVYDCMHAYIYTYIYGCKYVSKYSYMYSYSSHS